MDQIIIELIGDPSGLKPAEDALKNLGKVSQSAMDTFNKTNEAAARFALSAAAAGSCAKGLAGDAAKAGQSLGAMATHASGGIAALSKLSQTIQALAVKDMAGSFAKLSEKVREQDEATIERLRKLAVVQTETTKTANKEWLSAHIDMLNKKAAADMNAFKDDSDQRRRIAEKLQQDTTAARQQGVLRGAEAERAALLQFATNEKERLAIEEDYLAQKRKLRIGDLFNAAESGAQEIGIRKKIGSETIKQAQLMSDALFELRQSRRQGEMAAMVENLEARKNAELLNTTLTNAQRSAIERKYRNEEAQAKLQAWKADQKAKEGQAVINGLLAFTTSLAQQGYPAGLITGTLALVTAGIQAAAIAAKSPPRYARGTKGNETLPPGMKLVGEEGPEIIYTPGGEKVFTAQDTQKLLQAYKVPVLFPFMHVSQTALPVVPGPYQYKQPAAAQAEMILAMGRLEKKLENLRQVSIRIDENGFSKKLITKGQRSEYLNAQIKF